MKHPALYIQPLSRWVAARTLDGLHTVYWYNADGTINGVIDDSREGRWGTVILSHCLPGDRALWLGEPVDPVRNRELWHILLTRVAQKHPDVQALRANNARGLGLRALAGDDLHAVLASMDAYTFAAGNMRQVARATPMPAQALVHRAVEEAEGRAACNALEAACRYAMHGLMDPMEPK